MLDKPILMKCGHFADSFMEVQCDGEPATVAACTFCFKSAETVNQPACALADKQPDYEPLPEIEHNRWPALLAAGVCILTIVALIVSL